MQQQLEAALGKDTQGSGGTESPVLPGGPAWKNGFHLRSLLQGNIVALVHDSGDTEDEENNILLNGLSHQSHLILRAEGLATGFCRDVHGQVRRGSLGNGCLPFFFFNVSFNTEPRLCVWDSVRPWEPSGWGVPLGRRKTSQVVRMQVRVCSRWCWPPAPVQVFHARPVTN